MQIQLRPLLLALGPLPALAGPLPGADDPTFSTLMARLLTQDDRAAMAALHDLAARGNTAAAGVLVGDPVAILIEEV